MLSSFSIDVIDPCNRTGKINVPMKHVFETRGVVDHQRNPTKRDVKDLSLCLLFQKGRCNAGARCHQVHVDVDFVCKLRDEAATAKNCCATHGDIHSTGYLQMSKDIYVLDAKGSRQTYAITSFGRTTALDNTMRRANGTPSVTVAKICRLHTQGRCKFGKDCKNIHLCPNAKPVPPPAFTPVKQVASLSLSTQTSAAKDSCGLSNASISSTHSCNDSPLEKTMNPLNFSDLSQESSFAESGFSLFSQPMKSLKAESPQFEASGFEQTLSMVQKDLWSVEARSPAGWKPW